ncbi:actin cytoskeleton-regulatory complex protein pan1-like [Panicum miliaceum]|uniref:Actin cytoskeleton-regulatory complex protein pan1-like n=1 Tax=Panicum miliaceum TaxID=4540 RepID=A0A3L6QP14_PANMI|nr:actin cytoskeleton-regulatory complex protein pan1-like [Panicum miliaceum]
MVHQKEDQNSGQVSTNPSVTPAETNNQTPADKPGKKESCSSSAASSEDIDDDEFFQIEGPILGSTLSFGQNPVITDIRQQSSSSSNHGSHAPTDPKQSPSVQAMSRAPDECPDPKRIPWSIFARSKSSSPTDWSVTSNESLFSINVGNASFSKDHFFFYGKSGELSNPNDPLAPLPPLPRPSTSSSPMRSEKAKITAQASAKLKPAATREGDQDGDGTTDYIHSLSHRSDASATSFAFPILASDERNSGSVKDDPPELARQSTSHSQSSQQAEPPAEQQEAPKVQAEAETREADQQAPEPTPEPAPAPAPASAAEPTPQPPAAAKWFPCCSCCPFCC